MAAIKLDKKELGTLRFAQLREHMGWGLAQAVGMLGLFWAETRAHGIEEASQADLLSYVPAAGLAGESALQGLVAAGYVRASGSKDEAGNVVYRVTDNVGAAAKIQARKAHARKAGAASVAKRQGKPRGKKKLAVPAVAALPAVAEASLAPGAVAPLQPPTAYQLACRHTWEAYASAYQRQTGQLPARNAKTNALVAQLVQRLGHDEAPQVAAFYVGHPNPYYANRVWPLDALVKDAEPMRTQWAAKVRVTPQAAQAAAQQSHYEARRARLADEGI